MFARYRKTTGSQPIKSVEAAPDRNKPNVAKSMPERTPQKQPQKTPAPQGRTIATDRAEQRKQRMNGIKSDMHKRLLENLNLAALVT